MPGIRTCSKPGPSCLQALIPRRFLQASDSDRQVSQILPPGSSSVTFPATDDEMKDFSGSRVDGGRRTQSRPPRRWFLGLMIGRAAAPCCQYLAAALWRSSSRVQARVRISDPYAPSPLRCVHTGFQPRVGRENPRRCRRGYVAEAPTMATLVGGSISMYGAPHDEMSLSPFLHRLSSSPLAPPHQRIFCVAKGILFVSVIDTLG